MIDSITSEARKLLSVRSTYITVALTLILAIILSYSFGHSAKDSELADPNYLATNVRNLMVVIMIIPALVGLLLFAHEYRYNTIMYTLTAAKSRLQVLLSKVIVITGFIVLLALVIAILGPLIINGSIKGTLTPQTFNYGSILLRSLFYSWVLSMYAMTVVVLIRNQAGAITAYLVMPFVAENISSYFLKGNAKYLPFRSATDFLASGASIVPPLVYVVGLWGISYYFFLKRDAN